MSKNKYMRPASNQAHNKICNTMNALIDNKGVVSDFILNLSLVYPKFILKLCLIYDFFMINLCVTGYKLQVTSKIWRHIFVVRGEACARAVCPIACNTDRSDMT